MSQHKKRNTHNKSVSSKNKSKQNYYHVDKQKREMKGTVYKSDMQRTEAKGSNDKSSMQRPEPEHNASRSNSSKYREEYNGSQGSSKRSEEREAAISKKNKMRSADRFLKVTGVMLQLILNVIFYCFIVIALVKVSSVAYEYAFQIFGNVSAEESPGENKKVVIEKDATLKDITQLLNKKGLIVNEYTFYIRAKLSINEKRPIIPGKYVLNSSQNYEEILDILTNNEKEGTSK